MLLGCVVISLHYGISGFPQVDVTSHLLVDVFYEIREVDISSFNGTHFGGDQTLSNFVW